MHKYFCEICKTEFIRDWLNKDRPLPKFCSRFCYGKSKEKKLEHWINKKIGKLTVISVSTNRGKNGHNLLNCKCDCGIEKEILEHKIKSGQVSCGCWKSGRDRMYPTFMNKVQKTDTCWIWKGKITPHGYGHQTRRNSTSFAHRISYEYHTGKIPEGKMILHKCNNKLCVNPDHLYAGTAYDNAQDAIRDGVLAKRSLTSKRYKK